MTLGYRAVLRLPDSVDAVALAHDQVRSWLRGQKLAGSSKYGTHEVADWEGPGRHRLGPDAEMVEIRHHGSDGTRRL
ncbi:hypothetical protein [Kineococcus arenarius]|uniref:hypothetical protein n=1 Tax=Kineococcus sp. SYSU DK007 TaxID=3383128 RepID=UPI003D7E5415